jgi:hypothetical protein
MVLKLEPNNFYEQMKKSFDLGMKVEAQAASLPWTRVTWAESRGAKEVPFGCRITVCRR